LRFPDEAQTLYGSVGVQADFSYRSGAAIFIDGPHHDGLAQREEDQRKRAALEDLGLGVLAFRYDDDWSAIFKKWPGIFGAG
ncbi:MAG: endonuclease domain-containing protein, partial [Armatimonadetes bacterium]|nr:endonuclease domain-containing protein [Armatimonadota bacterium]